ncbi:hypothetical protein HC752_04930 [Vibrio sp. S9_S30]|uniref:hypothetical protein n=1 Tax=Vibrio sp. S9_S30 TaxID=2720226 RepID=UPI0016808875|nr:hypothetical protein [Vibrio sp. S9_S30]MBD1556274.1 hypothetical protein [Vibrio sp. S9_S30]
MNKYLLELHRACFSENTDIAEEARLLSRYLIEYHLVDGNEEYKKEVSGYLIPSENLRGLIGLSNQSLRDSGVELSEIHSFSYLFVNDLTIKEPIDRRWIASVIKQAGNVAGISESLEAYLSNHWRDDEITSGHILDVIWDVSILKKLIPTLELMSSDAESEELRDFCRTRVLLLKSL